jgi:hypothetical protein
MITYCSTSFYRRLKEIRPRLTDHSRLAQRLYSKHDTFLVLCRNTRILCPPFHLPSSFFFLFNLKSFLKTNNLGLGDYQGLIMCLFVNSTFKPAYRYQTELTNFHKHFYEYNICEGHSKSAVYLCPL